MAASKTQVALLRADGEVVSAGDGDAGVGEVAAAADGWFDEGLTLATGAPDPAHPDTRIRTRTTANRLGVRTGFGQSNGGNALWLLEFGGPGGI